MDLLLFDDVVIMGPLKLSDEIINSIIMGLGAKDAVSFRSGVSDAFEFLCSCHQILYANMPYQFFLCPGDKNEGS